MERLEPRIPITGTHRRHVEHLADVRTTAPDAPPSLARTALESIGSDADQRSDLLAGHAAELGQEHNQRAGQDRSNPGHGPEQSVSMRERGIGRNDLDARRAPDILVGGTRVAIVWDEPMPRVCRPWFLCRCGRRCRLLYLRGMIACGQCHGLAHASRHLRRQTPGVGRVERLRRKLGGCDVRPFAPLPPRKRGRSRAYHEKLVAMILAEEAKLIGHLGGVVRDLKRRIRVRKARGKW